MKKRTENLLYQFAHSEYYEALKDWFDEIVSENDANARGLDPNKEPHKISKLVGGTEILLTIRNRLDTMAGIE